MKLITLIALCGIILLVAVFAATALVSPTTPRNQSVNVPVTLKAGPGNNIVQMFEKVGSGDEGKVSRFPDGTTCTKYGGPTAVTIEGVSMTFYRLTCNGVTGYVNTKWVR